MTDITRLNELHAAATRGDWQRCQSDEGKCPCGLVWDANEEIQITVCSPQPLADAMWITESHNAWPAVAAELARLREFVQRVRKASRFRDDTSVAWSVVDYVDWLDETEKAGEL